MRYIGLVDDHALFTKGLTLLLGELPDNDLVVEAYTDIHDFIKASEKSQVEYSLVLLDYYLPKSTFTDNIAQLKERFPNCPVIVVSASAALSDSQIAIKYGACAFLKKDAAPEQLLETIASLLQGQTLNETYIHGTDSLTDFDLTSRQVEILTLIAKGYANKTVAQSLSISPETVKSHLKEIFRRIGVDNRIEAIDFARQHGLM
ncbi:MAG: LuxR C-terminal-related transcriptional regulator [Arenicella sp.]